MKRNKLIDIAIIAAILIALAVGFITYKKIRQTAAKQIEATSQVAFQVFLRGVTLTSPQNPVKVGDKTFISIRNVPYTDLEVVDVRADAKKTVVPVAKGKEPFILIDDYSQMFMYDMVVTVVDEAKITKDGAVVGGNKIKIGLPVTLEGKDYKFNGLISNLQIAPQNLQPQAQTEKSSDVQ